MPLRQLSTTSAAYYDTRLFSGLASACGVLKSGTTLSTAIEGGRTLERCAAKSGNDGTSAFKFSVALCPHAATIRDLLGTGGAQDGHRDFRTAPHL